MQQFHSGSEFLSTASAFMTMFVYLLHPAVIHVLKYEGGIHEKLPIVVYSLVVLFASFVVSWLALEMFRAVEKLLLKFMPNGPRSEP